MSEQNITNTVIYFQQKEDGYNVAVVSIWRESPYNLKQNADIAVPIGSPYWYVDRDVYIADQEAQGADFWKFAVNEESMGRPADGVSEGRQSLTQGQLEKAE